MRAFLTSSASTQSKLLSTGTIELDSGSTIQTSVARQGNAQCVSQYRADSPTAECQEFCSRQYKTCAALEPECPPARAHTKGG